MQRDISQQLNEEIHIGKTITVGGKELATSNDVVVERLAPGFHAVTVTLFTENLTIDVDNATGIIHLTRTDKK